MNTGASSGHHRVVQPGLHRQGVVSVHRLLAYSKKIGSHQLLGRALVQREPLPGRHVGDEFAVFVIFHDALMGLHVLPKEGLEHISRVFIADEAHRRYGGSRAQGGNNGGQSDGPGQPEGVSGLMCHSFYLL